MPVSFRKWYTFQVTIYSTFIKARGYNFYGASLEGCTIGLSEIRSEYFFDKKVLKNKFFFIVSYIGLWHCIFIEWIC